jgi:hypothetical protein
MPPRAPLNPFGDEDNWFGGGGYQAPAPGTYPQAQSQLDGQIAWIAAINGQTPQAYLDSQASFTPGQAAPLTPYQSWYGQQTAPDSVPRSIWDAQQLDDQFVSDEQARLGQFNTGLGALWGQQSDIETGAYNRGNMIGQQNAAMNQQNWGAVNTANSGNSAALGAYGNAVGAAGAWDMQNFSNLQAAAAMPMQMHASPYVGDAMSNPGDVARQQQVYGQLQGAANGSLDVRSQAAQAYANAQDVANQNRAAATLEASGNGALDVDLNDIRELDKLRDPDSIGGMRELYGVYEGSLDVRPGELDPAAYQAAVDNRNKLWSLTDPSVTAQEKLMFELARQQQEQDEGATRAALQTDARRRGVSGVGTEIARSALGAQQTSRNRMLQDMQALAQAQTRSQQALASHGNLSAQMNSEANRLAMNNAGNRLGALEGYTNVHASSANTLGQLGAANATTNANRQLQAQGMAYQAYAELRAQGFSEEYARGQAADVVAMSNSDRRLGAMNSSATLATNMRNASDSMSMFNQSQRQQQSQFSDNYTANRQDAQFNRAATVFDGGNTVGRNFMTDQGNLFQGTVNTNQTNLGNTQTGINTNMGLNQQWLNTMDNADRTATGGIQTRAGILGQQNANISQSNQLPMVNGRQRVQDAITIRGIRQDDEAVAQQRALQGGGSSGGGHYPATPVNNYPPTDPYGQPVLWNGGTPI